MATTVTPTVDTALARIRLDVVWTGASDVTISRVSADGTVMPVRNAEPGALVAGVWLDWDYEAPFDTAVYYVATSTYAPGVTITSATVTLPSQGQTWLRHPGKPYLSMPVSVSAMQQLTRPVEQGVFTVLGRRSPVAVTVARYSERGELTLYTVDASERARLLDLLDDGATLYLATPGGYTVGPYYIAVGETVENRPGLVTEPVRTWTLPFVTVDRPAGASVGVGNSWSDALGAYTDWTALLTTEVTWTGLLAGVGPDTPPVGP